jgi:hypothetical protein
MPIERALALPPSLELDMYIFQHIIQGPEDMLEGMNIGRLPAFSRKFGDCQILLIKAIMELGCLSVICDPGYFHEAQLKGFMVRKTPCIVWRVSAQTDKYVGYGRNFEEALCKLHIYAKNKA